MAGDSPPSPPAAEAPAPSPALDLQSFVASQQAGFYAYLNGAVKAFRETGELPAPLFSEAGKLKGAAKSKGGDGAKPKRGMSAFNYFVQRKAAQLKDSGGDAKTLMVTAAGEWKTLTDAQKKQFEADFKEHQAAAGAADVGGPAVNGSVPAADKPRCVSLPGRVGVMWAGTAPCGGAGAGSGCQCAPAWYRCGVAVWCSVGRRL